MFSDPQKNFPPPTVTLMLPMPKVEKNRIFDVFDETLGYCSGRAKFFCDMRKVALE